MPILLDTTRFEDLVVAYGEARASGGFRFPLIDHDGSLAPFFIHVCQTTGGVSLVHVVARLDGSGREVLVTSDLRFVLAGCEPIALDLLEAAASDEGVRDRLGLRAQEILLKSLEIQHGPERCRAGAIGQFDELVRAALIALPSWLCGGDPRYAHGFPRRLRLDMSPQADIDGFLSLRGNTVTIANRIDPGSPLAIALRAICRILAPDGTTCHANRTGRIVVKRETRLYEVAEPSAHAVMAARRTLRRFFELTPCAAGLAPLIFSQPPDPRLSFRSAILACLSAEPMSQSALRDLALARLGENTPRLTAEDSAAGHVPLARFDTVVHLMALSGVLLQDIDLGIDVITAARGPGWGDEMKSLGLLD